MTVPAGAMLLAERRAALEAFLAGAAGAARATLTDARPLAGGAIQENWRLDLHFEGGRFAGEQALVLRSDAPSRVAASHDRAAEFALLRAARDAGVTVPEPLWLCRDETVLGRPFLVLHFVEGVGQGHRIVKDPSLGGDRDALAERLGRELAAIHRITPPRADLGFLGEPPADPARAAVARYRDYLDRLGAAEPALEWGLRWCERHAPAPPPEIVFVHQDFRTGNYLVDGRGLAAVLDWEFCAWGDPMSDLGWFCAKCWRFGRADLEAGGIATREPFYRGYELASGRPVDPERVAYWEVMAHLRWAVIALQQGARTRDAGEDERALELALTGLIHPPALAREVLGVTAPEDWRTA